jgi:hypothetical protein
LIWGFSLNSVTVPVTRTVFHLKCAAGSSTFAALNFSTAFAGRNTVKFLSLLKSSSELR